MTVTMEISKLSELLYAAAESGATRALEKAGELCSTITFAEVKKQHGVQIAKEARTNPSIRWIPRANGGRKAGVYCKTADLDKFLFERKFSFNK